MIDDLVQSILYNTSSTLNKWSADNTLGISTLYSCVYVPNLIHVPLCHKFLFIPIWLPICRNCAPSQIQTGTSYNQIFQIIRSTDQTNTNLIIIDDGFKFWRHHWFQLLGHLMNRTLEHIIRDTLILGPVRRPPVHLWIRSLGHWLLGH